MNRICLLPVFIACYLCLIGPFTSYVNNKPFVEKMGYIPQPEVLTFATADQKQFTAAALIIKALVYFGGNVDKSVTKRIHIPVDYTGMRSYFEAAVKLDPYNMDVYYFVQAVLVWDMKQVKPANELLEYGMEYRDWDFHLPFFAGFNYGYFLHDYPKAAKYFKKVAELTGNPLSINLASRYMYESGQTDLAIAYLTTMEKGATNEALKKTFHIRLEALKSVKVLESARKSYKDKYGNFPKSVDMMLKKGVLKDIPTDPYGGSFYLDENGQVRTTSNFTYPLKK